MLKRWSLYLSHPGMSLHPIFKSIGRLIHFMITKSSSKRGCSDTISTASPMEVLCTELSDKKEKFQRVNLIPVSCSILTILPQSDRHFQGLSSRIKDKLMTHELCFVIIKPCFWQKLVYFFRKQTIILYFFQYS